MCPIGPGVMQKGLPPAGDPRGAAGLFPHGKQKHSSRGISMGLREVAMASHGLLAACLGTRVSLCIACRGIKGCSTVR